MSRSVWYNHDSAAEASSSKTRLPPPSPLLETPCVKVELGSPLQSATAEFSCLSTTDNQDTSADTYTDSPSSSTLITPPSPSRPYRPLTLQPSTTRLNPNTAALFSQTQNIQQTHHPQHDVLRFVNASLQNDFSEATGQHGSLRSTQLLPQCTPTFNHASINSSPRWTSSQPVSTSALAAQHGLPQSLPPVPRTTRYQSEKSVPSAPAPNNDFELLCANYLSMLAQKPTAENPDSVVTNEAAVSAVMELFTASPEFQDFGGSDFLTSPMDDSPWEELLATPALGTGDDLLTSPAIVDADDFGFGNGSLFADYAAAAVNSAPAEPIKQQPASRPSLPFDTMYTISPNTPSLDPLSLHPSPAVPQEHSPASQVPRRKNAPTGTRKNITPEALVPYDAPIQPRKYLTPSATSRKEIPAVFAKKRARSQAFEEDEDEDNAVLNPVEMDAIEAKRRQNTLAARRSRKRKLEYQRELEATVEREKEEKETWKQKALFYETLLKHHGLEVPSFP